APIGVIIIDTDAQVMDINHKGEDIFEIGRKHNKPNLYSMIDTEEKITLSALLDEANNFPQQTHVKSVIITTNNGVKKCVELTVSRAFEELGKKLIMVIAQDITQRVAAERQLKTAIENLKQLDVLKDQFISTITHELLTPLNGVRLSLSLLKSQVHESAHEIIDDAELSNRHLQYLVESMITFVEARRGDLRLHPKVFDLWGLLGRIFRQFEDMQSNDVNVQLQCHVSTPQWIVSDERKLATIVVELMKNAMEFTHKGEVMLISETQDTEHAREKVLTLMVRDTGSGISESKQSLIFEAFRQVDTSNTREHGGLGIGLTNVRDLMSIFNGQLELSSEIGQGSCFKINIPVVLATAPQIDTIEFPILPDDQPMKKTSTTAKILVVEDNPVNLRLLVKVLENEDYQTLSAMNGQEALNILQTDADIDAILMDCQMPVMDGYEACRQIRCLPQFKTLPIIAISANISESDRQRCLDVGMNDFLSKPTNRTLIINTLQQWLLKP
ncbi:MAG: response regulator, partial [Pseudomonadales bacterium]|nr:response regulator [Pseudomonadales bacterium]